MVRKKIGTWTDDQLQVALAKIDNGSTIRAT